MNTEYAANMIIADAWNAGRGDCIEGKANKVSPYSVEDAHLNALYVAGYNYQLDRVKLYAP